MNHERSGRMNDQAPGTIESAVVALKEGGIIAYPTEAVFGLGCDPGNSRALERLLSLKSRAARKGLILVAADIDQILPFIRNIDDSQWQQVRSTWPGPVTWVFPVHPGLSVLLTGDHNSIAIRVSAHPIVREICNLFGGPIVSTSANCSGQEPARSVQEVRQQFQQGIDVIVDGEVDLNARPSEIRDVLSGDIIRAG
jgi:L-threonylcarbamoyladenylate synthase